MVARKKKEAEEKAEMQDLKKEADLRLAELRPRQTEYAPAAPKLLTPPV